MNVQIPEVGDKTAPTAAGWGALSSMAALWAVPASQRGSVTHQRAVCYRTICRISVTFKTHNPETLGTARKQVSVKWKCYAATVYFDGTRVAIVQVYDMRQVWCRVKRSHNKQYNRRGLRQRTWVGWKQKQNVNDAEENSASYKWNWILAFNLM